MMNHFHCACLALFLAWALPCPAQEPAASPPGILETRIAALQKEFAEAATASSSVRKRRAYKNISRDGEKLLETAPAAPNRWLVLRIMLDSSKALFGMENSKSNRDALLEICARLSEAPDEHAEIRLEADLLLSEKDLSDKEASLEERAKALEAIIGRYRGTPAEAKSLMMAAQIAPKLDALELQRRVVDALGERFAGDPAVIAFRRQQLGLRRLDALFVGTHTRADGVTLRFPADLMGRLSLMVFWSQNNPEFEHYLKVVEEQQSLYPGRFEVFSFNVDELPDAGAGTLRSMQLDWTVMRLPGGRKSQTFRTYAQNDPVGVLVNAYGHALLAPTLLDAGEQAKLGVRGLPMGLSTLKQRLDEPRYLSQLQSLLVGDVLVTEPDGTLDVALPPELKMVPMGPGQEAGARLDRSAGSIPAETLRAIQECFTPIPFRYRLTTAEALARYEKAEKLCGEAIRQHPAAPDLWIVRNRRIIALLGMWNLSSEPRHFEEAAREARTSLVAKLPAGADIVPRFCLAMQLLRQGDSPPDSVLPDLIEKAGGADAPCSAHAAAAILALHANARDLHERHRTILLAAPDGGNPALWPMLSFLRDRIHRFRLMKGNYIHKEGESVRGYMVGHPDPPATELLPTLTLKTLDGRTLTLPQDTNGKMTMLVFVEPSAQPNAEFPVDIGAEGSDMKPRHHSMPRFACELADKHVNKDVITIVAFLSDDAERIAAVMKAREYTCQAAIVPGGLTNPMVRQLGILSADRIPNVFLLRRNGSIAWHASGLPYHDAPEFVALLATKLRIETYEVERAWEALEKGDFKEAARVFGGPYLPWNPDRYGWRAPRYHGQAMAYIGLQDWNAALEAVEKAIDAQKLRYFRERRGKDPTQWRKEAAKVTIQNPDETMVELWSVRAEILDNLGRSDEAAEMRKRAAEPGRPDNPSPYKTIHDKLRDWFKQHRTETQK